MFPGVADVLAGLGEAEHRALQLLAAEDVESAGTRLRAERVAVQPGVTGNGGVEILVIVQWLLPPVEVLPCEEHKGIHISINKDR